MKEELIVFTHNDLDAIGSILNIEFKIPDIPKKYFYTNYSNIPAQVDNIIEYAEANNCKHILIPDVSFADNKESLRRLYNYFHKVTHIDHHLYTDNFWDEFPNMTVVYDKTKCATKLCNEFFKNTGKNINLDKLTYIIDVYDLWQTENNAFDFAQLLNEYFWTWDIELLTKTIIQNGYKLPEDFQEVTQNIKNKYMKAIVEYESKNVIHRARDVTFCFINDWFNQVLLKEMENGQNFVIGINSYGIVRVRINKNSPYNNEQLNKFRIVLTETEAIGHMLAFTYRIKDFNGFDCVLKEASKIDNFLKEIFI